MAPTSKEASSRSSFLSLLVNSETTRTTFPNLQTYFMERMTQDMVNVVVRSPSILSALPQTHGGQTGPVTREAPSVCDEEPGAFVPAPHHLRSSRVEEWCAKKNGFSVNGLFFQRTPNKGWMMRWWETRDLWDTPWVVDTKTVDKLNTNNVRCLFSVWAKWLTTVSSVFIQYLFLTMHTKCNHYPWKIQKMLFYEPIKLHLTLLWRVQFAITFVKTYYLLWKYYSETRTKKFQTKNS